MVYNFLRDLRVLINKLNYSEITMNTSSTKTRKLQDPKATKVTDKSEVVIAVGG